MFHKCGRCKTEVQQDKRDPYGSLPPGTGSFIVMGEKGDNRVARVLCGECAKYFAAQCPWDSTGYERCDKCNEPTKQGSKRVFIAASYYEFEKARGAPLVCEKCLVELSKTFKRWEG